MLDVNLLLISTFLAFCGNQAVEVQQIQAAKAYQCIYDPGKPGHASEQQCHQVNVKESDQSPVNGTDHY